MRLQFLNYRYAGAVLDHPDFKESKDEIVKVLKETTVPLLNPEQINPKQGGVKRRGRNPLRGSDLERFLFIPVDQKRMNADIDNRFKALGWQLQPSIVAKDNDAGPKTGLKGDFKKGRLQVEIQFGNMARWYTDVFKFQLSYSLDAIDIAVLVVPTQAFSNLIDENIANFERVARELPWAKMSLTLPIWVIGIEPDDYSAIQACYEAAALALDTDRRAKGHPGIVMIPFNQRLTEEAPELET